MSSVPSTFPSHTKFSSIFSAALESYRRKTKKDLASHPLLPCLQQCDSPEAILSVLREQIPTFDQSQNCDDETSKWVIPTVNVLNAFSGTLGRVVGLAFPPASIVFAGIGVLLSAAKDASAYQDKLIDVFNRIERFFQRLNIYTGFTPSEAMTDIIVEIMVEVLNILAIATKEVKSGRLKRWLKKLAGNSDIEDSLGKLDKLTQEEARMVSAESLRVTHSVDGKMMAVDSGIKVVGDRMKVVEGEVRNARSDVQDVGNKVEGVEETVQAIHDDVKDVGNMIRIAGSEMRDVSSGVRGVGDEVDRVKRNQLRESLLRWLSAPDPSVNHNIALKAHHTDTSQWFFQGRIFNKWKSSGSLLWVHGKPGSGKTILCSSIIEDIKAFHDAGTALMADFYFDFMDVKKQNLRNLLPSLLIQLSARSDPCCDILSQLYSTHDRGIRKPSDRDMVECLKKMLRSEEQVPIYIIMDALDECPNTSTIPSPREEVLDFVDELVVLHLPNLHICVTSRPEYDIRAVLERLTERPVSLHDESGQQEDIANYVASAVRSDRRMRRWREEDKNLVIKTLSEKADGMFRWAFCQLDVLRYCLPSSVRGILNELPESLDETYERILRGIRGPNQRHAHRLLQCLVAAVSPLRVEQLAEVLAFDFDAVDAVGIPKINPDWRRHSREDQEEAIMSACSNLVTIVNNSPSRGIWTVRFSHFSVKEFLMSNRLAEPIRDVSRYHIRLDAAHTTLVRTCLGVLLQLNDRLINTTSPLVHYAADDWVTHARFEDVTSRIRDAIRCLFDADKPHFATWCGLLPKGRQAYSGRTDDRPLFYAASFGFRDAVEHIIVQHPEKINATGNYGLTPLHVATMNGFADVVSLLLKHGADVAARDSRDMTPLHLASLEGKLEAGLCLLDHGADINSRAEPYKVVPLRAAVHKGHAEFARMLLERGAAMYIRITEDWRDIPLIVAVKLKNVQMVRLLLEYGEDANERGKEGKTPSQWALLDGQQEILELLSEYGAKSAE